MTDRLITSLVKLAFRIGWEQGQTIAFKNTCRNPDTQELQQEREIAMDDFMREHLPDGKLFPHRTKRRIRGKQ
jgi:hypothetical protein